MSKTIGLARKKKALAKTAKTDRKPPARVDKFDLGRAIKMRYEQNMSYSEMSKILGVSMQAIQQRLAGILSTLQDRERIQTFVSRESEVLSAARSKLLSAALEDKTIKKSSTLQLVSSYGFCSTNND